MTCMRPKTSTMLSVSQVLGFASAICRGGLRCKCIEFAGMSITVDCRVESIGLKRFKPSTKPR